MKKVLLAFMSLGISNYSNIKNNEKTIIEGLKLGTTTDNLYHQMDSLKLDNKIFYSTQIATDSEELENSKFRIYYTKLFNDPEYVRENRSHLGLFYPTHLSGTDNVVSLNVLLGHTGPAKLFSKLGISDLTEENGIQAFDQTMTQSQIEDIQFMLTEKYGKPKDTLRFDFLSFFVIERNKINSYKCDTSNIGEMLIWENDYFDIKFFKGIISPNRGYNSKSKTYMIYFDDNPFREVDYQNGERLCMSYAYINYELNYKAINGLKLRETK